MRPAPAILVEPHFQFFFAFLSLFSLFPCPFSYHRRLFMFFLLFFFLFSPWLFSLFICSFLFHLLLFSFTFVFSCAVGIMQRPLLAQTAHGHLLKPLSGPLRFGPRPLLAQTMFGPDRCGASQQPLPRFLWFLFRGGKPEGWRPLNSAYFFLLPPHISFLLLSLVVFCASPGGRATEDRKRKNKAQNLFDVGPNCVVENRFWRVSQGCVPPTRVKNRKKNKLKNV